MYLCFLRSPVNSLSLSAFRFRFLNGGLELLISGQQWSFNFLAAGSERAFSHYLTRLITDEGEVCVDNFQHVNRCCVNFYCLRQLQNMKMSLIICRSLNLSSLSAASAIMFA
jgi:hypothetical protein